MKYELREDILKETSRCAKDCACLSDEGYPLCKVQHSVEDGDILFVTNVQNAYCHYLMPFGDSFMCNCPVRRELYKSYRI